MPRSRLLNKLPEAAVVMPIYVPLRLVSILNKNLPAQVAKDYQERLAEYEAFIKGRGEKRPERLRYSQWLSTKEATDLDLKLRKQGNNDLMRSVALGEAYANFKAHNKAERERLSRSGRSPDPPTRLNSNDLMRLRLFEILKKYTDEIEGA
jgi:hypothetical protein